jgi:hypothetical protein
VLYSRGARRCLSDHADSKGLARANKDISMLNFISSIILLMNMDSQQDFDTFAFG